LNEAGADSERGAGQVGRVSLPSEHYQPKPPMQAPEPSSKPRKQDMLTKF
jgi:hypothetical protein